MNVIDKLIIVAKKMKYDDSIIVESIRGILNAQGFKDCYALKMDKYGENYVGMHIYDEVECYYVKFYDSVGFYKSDSKTKIDCSNLICDFLKIYPDMNYLIQPNTSKNIMQSKKNIITFIDKDNYRSIVNYTKYVMFDDNKIYDFELNGLKFLSSNYNNSKNKASLLILRNTLEIKSIVEFVEDENSITLNSISTRKKFRGQSLSSKLFLDIVKMCKEKGKVLIRTEPSDDGFEYTFNKFTKLINDNSVNCLSFHEYELFQHINDAFIGQHLDVSFKEKFNLIKEVSPQINLYDACNELNSCSYRIFNDYVLNTVRKKNPNIKKEAIKIKNR